mgnify:CR=1 FL=1|tara:strand:- start:1070 stop:2401 length:1332 start_codon:yes stop_codon:yes gene_type:complete
MKNPKKSLVLVELNEINFNFVEKYCKKYKKNFFSLRKLLASSFVKTKSEEEYQNLEPWIQWVSAHTGKKFNDHKVFRLGDIVNKKTTQIFEKVEDMGFSVGCVSPMNTKNSLRNSLYFIPDPWTKTIASGKNIWPKLFYKAFSQTVNDNSKSKITFLSIFILAITFLRFARFKHINKYFKLALTSYKRPWRKALFLDLLINDIHFGFYNKFKPNFSTVFFNAGAHIQHHYFFNSEFLDKTKKVNPSWYINPKEDPIFEMLEIYDLILSDHLVNEEKAVLIGTGLSQIPHQEVNFYYRLKDHGYFLNLIGISFESIIPRMTRDFLINFKNRESAKSAEKKLSIIKLESSGEKIFNSIDNRGNSLFVTFTYSKEIKNPTSFSIEGKSFNLFDLVNFVAIKNGEHSQEGLLFYSQHFKEFISKKIIHVGEIFNIIHQFFKKDDELY